MRPNFRQQRYNSLMWTFYPPWNLPNLHLKNLQYESVHDWRIRYHVQVLPSDNTKFVLTLPNDELLGTT
ncbi:hypothetical protein LguiA_025451 [Lonicera macranthoides]